MVISFSFKAKNRFKKNRREKEGKVIQIILELETLVLGKLLL